MENPNDRPKKDLVNVRIAPELRQRIAAIGARTGRTTNAQLVVCAELGCHFDAMTDRGGHADLLNDLFAVINVPRGTAIDKDKLHSLIDDYFAKAQS